VGDLGNVIEYPVELAGPETDATTVEGGVGAAGHLAGPLGGEPDPVAVAPHARVVLEVRLPVSRAVRVVPESEGHRGHRLGDHELAELADELAAVGVERARGDAEAGPGDLSFVHGLNPGAADDCRAH